MASNRNPLEHRVLLLAPTERDGIAGCSVMNAVGIDCAVLSTLPQLVAELDRGVGAVMMAEEAVKADTMQDLARAIQKQPVWSDLPVIVLSRSGMETPTIATALATLGNVSLVERPSRVTTLVSVVKTALRARERQYEVRDNLAERIKSEADLRSNRQRLQIALEAARLGSFRVDLASGLMTCSDQCKVNIGVPTTQDVSYAQLVMLIHPDDRDRMQAAVKKAVDDRAVFECEYRVGARGLAPRWIFASGRAEYLPDGSPLAMVGVTLDITARKQNEDALRVARDNAESASRAKDRFLAVLSHELRTPLTPVMMAASLLERSPNLNDTARESVAMIRRNVDLECRLIDDLLDLSRVIAGKLHLQSNPVRVHEVLRSTLQYCTSPIYGKRIKIKQQYDATNDHLQGDVARLQQVFWNLLSNATKFTPEGGEISLLTWNDATGKLCVQVKDTGVGIPSEVLPKVFEAFEQGDSRVTHQFGGLGLGLAIVKAVVDLHGGTIRAESLGKNLGASFTVELATIATVVPAVPKPANGQRKESKSTRVLLVEDHPDTADVMRGLLTAMGHQVMTAATVAGALSLAESQRFDVVVSDIGLPDASGYELMSKLQSQRPLPGIALSGYGMEEDVQRSRKAGFADHLVKPVDILALEAVIRRVVSAGA